MQHLTEILRAERDAAEATLGRPLIDPLAFAADFLALGLGEALNREHDRIDGHPVTPETSESNPAPEGKTQRGNRYVP